MKKIFVSEESLLKLKNTVMVSENNTNHDGVLCNDKPLAERDKYEIGGEGGNNDYFHITSENIESEVEASEVSLDSFKKNDTLAPKIWDGFELNPKVRLKLLDIADDFWDFTNVTWVKRDGIHLTGSICNFNWSKYSDIDLHIVADFSKIDDRVDFVQEYFNAKKTQWNDEHGNLKIYGYQVELYVEDVNAETTSSGLYDLEENKWIKKPNKDEFETIKLDKYDIKTKSAKLMTSIDDLVDEFNSTDDDAQLRDIGRRSKKLLSRIKNMRKFGLNRGGESDSLNIVYKVLRRQGYLDDLWDLSSRLYDKINSIGVNESLLREYLEKDHNYPLYRYFKWADDASDEEKAYDLAANCPWYMTSYVDELKTEIDEDEIPPIDGDNSSDVRTFVDLLVEYGKCDEFIDWVQYYGDYSDFPSWMTMEFMSVVKNEWCIHFTEYSDDISKEGFTQGTPDLERLAYTNAGGFKAQSGYDFAFLVNDGNVDFNNYGSEAVIFRTSGVLVWHHGDGQRQVIFYGPNVKEFIPIKYDSSEGWVIEGKHYQILKAADKPSELVKWVMDNLPQYRKEIMTGKSGYIPKRYNPVTQKSEPYSLFKNESIKNYLNVLKEEVNADGNAQHNMYAKRWAHEREVLKNYLTNYGEIMTSKENGKQYKVVYDTMLSQNLGINYCLCIQWDPLTFEPGNVIYVRAYDKFTKRIFKPQFDTRGLDNTQGTADDVV